MRAFFSGTADVSPRLRSFASLLFFQLASIGAAASSLTATIKANAGLETDQASMTRDEPPLLSTPSKGFKVGSLECKYPSPVVFFKDKVRAELGKPWRARRWSR